MGFLVKQLLLLFWTIIAWVTGMYGTIYFAIHDNRVGMSMFAAVVISGIMTFIWHEIRRASEYRKWRKKLIDYRLAYLLDRLGLNKW